MFLTETALTTSLERNRWVCGLSHIELCNLLLHIALGAFKNNTGHFN